MRIKEQTKARAEEIKAIPSIELINLKFMTHKNTSTHSHTQNCIKQWAAAFGVAYEIAVQATT